MRTDDLVAALAQSAGAVDPAAVARRFSVRLLAAAALSIAAMLVLVGPRADWREAMDLPMFWLKLGFPAAVAAASLACLRRLGHPGMSLGAGPLALVAPVLLVWGVAAGVLAGAPAPDRLGLVMGSSWWQCPLMIAALSVPAFVLAFRAMSVLAPTRLGLTGGIAGLFAGSAAAFAYAFSCVEMQAPFLAVWYALGMLIPALVGAALGRRLLRW